MKKLIFAFLLFAAPVWAADYTVSTSTPARERALAFEAARAGKTKAEVLQDLADRYLDDRGDRMKEAREKSLREGYEVLSPIDKTTVDRLIRGVP